ncbi:hypothetical protein DFH08DRAFT_815131 [Mycena albidolilacea]|uniref:Uncharacterized protein n=1 Tax=Mycena albidolilacea TaxID=1033008 RepID=A0AAD7EJL7_9AGAR|nr:hypothetical protein DFH08DRAFT_815131 [Mycena albidolilacea]
MVARDGPGKQLGHSLNLSKPATLSSSLTCVSAPSFLPSLSRPPASRPLRTSIASAGSLTVNYYGAPIAPWKAGHHPGWWISVPRHLLPLRQHKAIPPASRPAPPPPPKYPQTDGFYDLKCALQNDKYCEAMCDSVAGCVLINTYHDVNEKNGSPQLTCALFSKCLTAASADNCGGQSQPDGSIDYSNGYCKKY